MFVANNIDENFVFVPTSMTGGLVAIETAFGVASTQATSFELVAIDSANQTTTIATWTHTASTKHYIKSVTYNQTLPGKTVYIRCTEGGAGAYGYTATLMWQQ